MSYVSDILKSEDCFATTVTAISIKDLGWESLEWLPETVRISLERKYGELPLSTLNKLFAGYTLLTTDFYWTKFEVFNIINGVLWDGIVDNSLSDIEEICWGLTEASFIYPEKKGLSANLKAYSLLAAYQAGLIKSPTILKRLGIFFDLTPYLFEDLQESSETINILTAKQKLADELDSMVVTRTLKLIKQLREAELEIPEELKVIENLGINI